MARLEIPERARIFFEPAWQDGNFLIPADWALRAELRQQCENFVRTGAMHSSDNEKMKTALRARIAAIDAYNDVLFKARKKK